MKSNIKYHKLIYKFGEIGSTDNYCTVINCVRSNKLVRMYECKHINGKDEGWKDVDLDYVQRELLSDYNATIKSFNSYLQDKPKWISEKEFIATLL